MRRIGVCGFGLWPSHGHRAQVATRDEPAESSAASPAESTGAECAGGFEAGTRGGAQVRAGGGSAFTRAAFARAAAGRAACFPTCVSAFSSAFSKRDASESDPFAAGGSPLGSRSVNAEGSAFDARSLDAQDAAFDADTAVADQAASHQRGNAGWWRAGEGDAERSGCGLTEHRFSQHRVAEHGHAVPGSTGRDQAGSSEQQRQRQAEARRYAGGQLFRERFGQSENHAGWWRHRRTREDADPVDLLRLGE